MTQVPPPSLSHAPSQAQALDAVAAILAGEIEVIEAAF